MEWVLKGTLQNHSAPAPSRLSDQSFKRRRREGDGRERGRKEGRGWRVGGGGQQIYY